MWISWCCLRSRIKHERNECVAADCPVVCDAPLHLLEAARRASGRRSAIGLGSNRIGAQSCFESAIGAQIGASIRVDSSRSADGGHERCHLLAAAPRLEYSAADAWLPSDRVGSALRRDATRRAEERCYQWLYFWRRGAGEGAIAASDEMRLSLKWQ